ncbi:cyclic nucleotide-gated cation channel beta-1-like, partial [Notothenia coriiceps]|uniref:Cyclic nucleotide-gated cation channel beta-1-like n=1 Tax=Notothenia coriiceps TaxID=8208 RepID=A0A6I9PJU1_9TELE
MLSWVAKVVPQPPEPPPKNVEEQKLGKPVATPPAEKKVTFLDESKQQAQKEGKPKQEVKAVESGPEPVAQSGVFTWFNATLPKPALPPNLSRANSVEKEENTTTRKGMMAWISEGLEKVVPQPDLKKETPAEPEQLTELSAVTAVLVAAPEKPAEPQINVEEREEHTDKRLLPPRMLDWIKKGLEKVVPQPKTEIMERPEAPAEAKAPEPAPATKAAPETE